MLDHRGSLYSLERSVSTTTCAALSFDKNRTRTPSTIAIFLTRFSTTILWGMNWNESFSHVIDPFRKESKKYTYPYVRRWTRSVHFE